MSTPHELTVGVETVLESRPSRPPFRVVFEDDGETGYLYALDDRQDENPMVDALHIYDAEDMSDPDAPSVLRFDWSEDEAAVALVLDDHAHAFIDFEASLAMCSSDFPPVEPPAFAQSHAWDEEAFKRRFPNLTSDWSRRLADRFTREQVDALSGAKLLVGLTYIGPDGEVARQLEFAGTIEQVGPDV